MPPHTMTSSHFARSRAELIRSGRRRTRRCTVMSATTISTLASGRERGVPLAIQVGGAERRQHVEAEHHPLRSEHLIQEQRDRKQREQDPELFVHALELPELRSSHATSVADGVGGGTSRQFRARAPARDRLGAKLFHPASGRLELPFESDAVRFGRLQLLCHPIAIDAQSVSRYAT